MLKFEENIPMSQLTTLQIGGPARLFTIVKTEDELREAIAYVKYNQLPYLIIGGGSNLLISDHPLNCLVIKNEIEGIVKTVRVLKVKSGFNLQYLVDYSIANNLAGLQKLNGIPGTLGGAVFGNAGAYGQTISDYIREVSCLNPQTGQMLILQKDECEFNYRDSIFKKNNCIILEVTFTLEAGPQPASRTHRGESAAKKNKELRQEADEILEKRLIKYPKGIKCPGSFFKNLIADRLPKEILNNIPKDKIVYGKLPAGSLLEMVGAKGDFLGDIEIASYHANLFINKGKGTASDFYQLAKKYAQKVKDKFGITLEPEVQLINLPALN